MIQNTERELTQKQQQQCINTKKKRQQLRQQHKMFSGFVVSKTHPYIVKWCGSIAC